MSSYDMDIQEDELVIMSDAQQYFFFKLGGDIYAIEAQNVTEMLEYQSYTKVPMMPSYVKGVTNIRGEITTVIDLLDRFSLGKAKINKKSSLVIVDSIALIIDEVYEVTAISKENIKSSLDFGCKIEKQFIKNMAYYQEEYIAILNCEALLDLNEISKIEVNYE